MSDGAAETGATKLSRKDRVGLLHTLIAPNVLHVLIRGVLSTCRVTTINARLFADRCRAGKNNIFSAWHSQVLTLPYFYRYRYGFRNLTIMVSRSRDGELLKRLLTKFDIETVRGSTTRGGMAAIKALIRVGRAGRDTALNLDGSKGPRCIAQPGALLLAQLTGAPLLPLACRATPCITLPTWDRMMVPLPFSRVIGEFAEPFHIPRDAKDLAPYLRELQEIMDRMDAHLDRIVSGTEPWPATSS